MVSYAARVARGGELAEIGAEDLVPGDVMVLEPGDAVSADARVLEAHALSIEMAALTGGEPAVRAGACPPLCRCRWLSGCGGWLAVTS